MAIYYLHLHDGGDLTIDDEGREFADRAAVLAQTLIEARGIISADVLSGQLDLGRHIDVADAGGRIVHRLTFADAVEIILPASR